MATAAAGIRQRVAAAGRRIQRVKRLDRLATFVITLGGVFIVASVAFIFVFIFGQTVPLFRAAQGRSLGVLPPEQPGAAVQKPLAIGVDEYQRYLYEVRPDARIVFRRIPDGTVAHEFPLTAIAGAQVTTASRSLQGDFVAAGTADGRVALAQVHFRPRYEGSRLVDLDPEVRERGLVAIDPGGRAVRDVSYEEQDERKAVAALVGEDEIALWQSSGEGGEGTRESLRSRNGDPITQLELGRVDRLMAGTRSGALYQWELGPETRLSDVVQAGADPITAMVWTVGTSTLIAGDAKGGLSGWSNVRLREEDERLHLVRAHSYASRKTGIEALAASTRDKSFASAGADGSVVLHHQTSERTLISFGGNGGQALAAVLITPKNDGIVAAQADGGVLRYEIQSPHPEVSWRALMGKVWYEGYSQPEYVWQSTGATSDFEPKLSLVPLIFGTIKGTLYAMLFAVPLAVMGALYTSQFVHPAIRSRIKPAVEIMAALPSVVIGFLAGLWLASRMERNVVPVILMVLLLPAFGTAGILLWDRLPRTAARRLKPGMEVLLILPLLLVAGWAAMTAGPWLERVFFGGDFKLWLSSSFGLVYDPRNCLVVGIAMGFAVIPIIFTISEDAFSSVPSHLTAASLALGASRWQTAVRVVLPTASPGIFSAVMVGFGRAVGETMIVLMATGNTPVLDWSIFNGMRTLSANIAVEVPEAPFGGTLYRVLFLAGGVLFLMTFLVNTLAELIRQRLREKYRAL